MTSIIPTSGELASLSLAPQAAQTNPQNLIDNILKSLSELKQQVAGVQSDLQSAADSLLGSLGSFAGLSDILSLSPAAQKIAESPTDTNTFGNPLIDLPALPAEQAFGFSSSLKLSISIKSLSYSSSTNTADGTSSQFASYSAIKLSINASTKIKYDDGNFYAVSKISVSFKGFSVSSSSISENGGTTVNKQASKFGINLKSVFQSQVGGLQNFAPLAVNPDGKKATPVDEPVRILVPETKKSLPEAIKGDPVTATKLIHQAIRGDKVEATKINPEPHAVAGEEVDAQIIDNLLDAPRRNGKAFGLGNFFSSRFPLRLDRSLTDLGGFIFSPSSNNNFYSASQTDITIKASIKSVTSNEGSTVVAQAKIKLAVSRYFSQQTSNYLSDSNKALAEKIFT